MSDRYQAREASNGWVVTDTKKVVNIRMGLTEQTAKEAAASLNKKQPKK